jgi:hypothetical protein
MSEVVRRAIAPYIVKGGELRQKEVSTWKTTRTTKKLGSFVHQTHSHWQGRL